MVEKKKLAPLPKRVERRELTPAAQRATSNSTGRALLAPLKSAADKVRRWLLATLGAALAPSAREHDEHTSPRTLLALLRAPGKVRLEANAAEVTLTLPRPRQPHRPLANAPVAFDALGLSLDDGARAVRFRLAPSTTREFIEVRNRVAEHRSDSRG